MKPFREEEAIETILQWQEEVLTVAHVQCDPGQARHVSRCGDLNLVLRCSSSQPAQHGGDGLESFMTDKTHKSRTSVVIPDGAEASDPILLISDLVKHTITPHRSGR